MFWTYPDILLSSHPFVLQVTKVKETCSLGLQAITIYYRLREHRLGPFSTLRCIKTALIVPTLHCDSLRAATFNTVCCWHLPQSWTRRPISNLKAGLFFFFFFLAPLHTTASQHVNHTARPHCAAWPTGSLAMATQIPADLAVKNRSSQKYERQESLIQFACMLFAPWTKMSWSHD